MKKLNKKEQKAIYGGTLTCRDACKFAYLDCLDNGGTYATCAPLRTACLAAC